MKIKALGWTIIPFLLMLIIACNNSSNSKVVVQGKDTLELWADTSLRVIVNEQKKAFENTYSNPFLQIVYAHESVIIDRLMHNKLNCAILQRNLTTDERAYIMQKEDFDPKQYTMAYDAFVFVTSRNNTMTFLSDRAVEDYFRNPIRNILPFSLVFENNHCQAIPYFQSHFHLEKDQIASAYTKTNLNELMDFLRTDSHAIGIIPFSYISDLEAASTLELLKDLKVLPVNCKDSLKREHIIDPSQSSITTREYPFTMPIVLLNCNMEKKSGTTFVNYILKPRAQRLLLRCGLVPAIFPAREVRVNTK